MNLTKTQTTAAKAIEAQLAAAGVPVEMEGWKGSDVAAHAGATNNMLYRKHFVTRQEVANYIAKRGITEVK